MAKVTMRVHMSGTRSGLEWPPPGHILECDEAEALQLCASGIAIPHVEDKVETTAAPTAMVEKRKPGRPPKQQQ